LRNAIDEPTLVFGESVSTVVSFRIEEILPDDAPGRLLSRLLQSFPWFLSWTPGSSARMKPSPMSLASRAERRSPGTSLLTNVLYNEKLVTPLTSPPPSSFAAPKKIFSISSNSSPSEVERRIQTSAISRNKNICKELSRLRSIKDPFVSTLRIFPR